MVEFLQSFSSFVVFNVFDLNSLDGHFTAHPRPLVNGPVTAPPYQLAPVYDYTSQHHLLSTHAHDRPRLDCLTRQLLMASCRSKLAFPSEIGHAPFQQTGLRRARPNEASGNYCIVVSAPVRNRSSADRFSFLVFFLKLIEMVRCVSQ
jgi:hypothetical protein